MNCDYGYNCFLMENDFVDGESNESVANKLKWATKVKQTFERFHEGINSDTLKTDALFSKALKYLEDIVKQDLKLKNDINEGNKSNAYKEGYPSGHVMVKRRRNNVVSTSVTSIQRCFNVV